jgi:hypothetical protein
MIDNQTRRAARRLSVFGVAAVVCLAMGAIGASAASALSFTWEPTTLVSEQIVSSPNTLFKTGKESEQVSCFKPTEGTVTFTSSSGTKGSAILAFRECRMGGPLGPLCQTPGSSSGRVVTSNLPVYPVYLDAAKTKFGLQIGDQGTFGQPATGSTWASEVNCSGVRTFKWNGSVLSQVTSPGLNESATTFSVNLSGTGTTQQYEWVEGNMEYPWGNFRHLSQSRDGGKSYEWMSMTSSTTLSMTEGKKGKFIP